jgi:hypothetical protein
MPFMFAAALLMLLIGNALMMIFDYEAPVVFLITNALFLLLLHKHDQKLDSMMAAAAGAPVVRVPKQRYVAFRLPLFLSSADRVSGCKPQSAPAGHEESEARRL